MWKIFGYPDLPPKNFKLDPRANQYSGHVYIPRSYKMVFLYQEGKSLEEIANIFSCTRERVRQCIWKEYRKKEMKINE